MPLRSPCPPLLALLAGLSIACPHKTATPVAGPGRPTVAADVALLTIPPGADTEAALQRLDEHAESGNTAAAWARLHYELDLFDDARFRRDDDSLRVLAAALGESVPAERGPAATDAALAALFVEADRVLALDRLHAGALAARTLIEFDANPPAERAAIFQRMVELKTIATGGGALQHNARLRLFGFCRQAFVDAAKAPRRARAEVLSFCLYPLYGSDPAPYFSDDARERPPYPDWRELSERALALIAPVSEGEHRLAAAGEAVTAAWQKMIGDREAALPIPNTPAALGVPTVERAEPFDWAPLLAIGDGHAIASRDALVAQLRAALEGDPRGTVAVGLYGRTAADSLYVVAGAAVEAGAHRLELAVGFPQKLQVPAGDYWFGRTTDGTIQRLGVIPLALATMPGAPPAVDSEDPRGLGWDPRRAALGLHLVVGRAQWELVAPTGSVARIPTDRGDPRAGLQAALAEVRDAFPDEDGLVLVIGEGATFAALVSAATAATRTADGDRLFARLALATAPPAAVRTKQPLARRIARRAAARVELAPDSLAARAPVVRRCYQDLLERSPKLGGEVRIELREGEPAVVSGPRNEALRACALAGVAAPMKKHQIASVAVTLAPR